MVYTVPEYYPGFICKGSGCRRTCCRGWRITLSMSEYYRMLGLPCRASMRRRLDTAFSVLGDPSEERYAEVNKGYDGYCPLLSPDGLCSLQCSCGADVLPSVCRLYPRSPRSEYMNECSCSNSCEAVVEALMKLKEPLCFVAADLPYPAAGKESRPLCYTEIRGAVFRLLQERRIPLAARISAVGSLVCGLRDPVAAKDEAKAKQVIARHASSFYPGTGFTQEPYRYFTDIHMLIKEFVKHSPSMGEFGEAALAAFGLDGELPPSVSDTEKAALLFSEAAAHMAAVLPSFDVYFENLIVNHLFYDRFPFSGKHADLTGEYVSLCALYAVMRFVTFGNMIGGASPDDFADCVAGIFRYAEHSGFDALSSRLLASCGCGTAETCGMLLAF